MSTPEAQPNHSRIHELPLSTRGVVDGIHAAFIDRSNLNESSTADGLTPEERHKRFMSGPIGQILEVTEKYPPLPEDEIENLIKRYQNHGDLEAKELVGLHNSRFVFFRAKYYHGIAPKQTVGLEDLFQQGMMGIYKAVEKVKLDVKKQKNAKFISFAGYSINQYITNYLNENRGAMRLPPGVGFDIGRHQLLERQAVLRAENDRDEEVAKLLSDYPIEPPEVKDEREHEDPFERMYSEARTARAKDHHEAAKQESVEKVRQLRLVADRIRPNYISRIPAQAVEDIPDTDEAIDPVVSAYIQIRRQSLDEAIEQIDARGAEVIRLRYNEDALTLDQVGYSFDVTRERIRQIENESLKKLQYSAESVYNLADTDDIVPPVSRPKTENERWFEAQTRPRSFMTAREYTDEKRRLSQKRLEQ